jgi:hypothetical protein
MLMESEYEGEYTKKSLGFFVLACILTGLLIWELTTGRICFVDGLTVELVSRPLGSELFLEPRKIKINFIFVALVPIIPAIISIYCLVIGKFFDDGDALEEHQLRILNWIVGIILLALTLIVFVAFGIVWDIVFVAFGIVWDKGIPP